MATRAKRAVRNDTTGLVRGKGTVDRLPSGRWRARVYEGAGQRSLSTFATEQEAIDALDAAEWVPVSDAAVTLDGYHVDWMTANARRLAPRTLTNYEREWRLYVAPVLGRTPLRSLAQRDIDAWWRDLEREHGHPSLVAAKAWRHLQTILRAAERDGRLGERIHAPVVGAGREQSPERPLLADKVVVALIEATTDRYRAVPLLAAAAGLRYSEIMALQRQHVDLERLRLDIRQAVRSWVPFVVGAPKSRAGTRVISIGEAETRILSAHAERYVAPEPIAWFFPGERGGRPMAKSNFARLWGATCAEAGVDPSQHRLHDLRHWHLTRAAGHMPLATLLARGGHSSAEIGLRYQHRSATADRAGAEAVSGLLKRAN